MDVRSVVYRVTDSIWLGPFASPARKPALQAARITHILNVGEAPSVLSAVDGAFRAVEWYPIVDLEPISEQLALVTLEALHRMVCESDARVYVHCIAGQNRSPTVVWLYLVACGLAADTARGIVETRVPDAIAGHSKLVGEDLVRSVRKSGAQSFLPHPRPNALISAD